MAQNLKARLAQIRNLKMPDHKEVVRHKQLHNDPTAPKTVPSRINKTWNEVAYKVLCRKLSFPFTIQSDLPPTLPRLIPDFYRDNQNTGSLVPLDRLLFFDLETTGLSGGAGTVAFLAAFGQFAGKISEKSNKTRLEITQFLLLDYPGEADFISQILSIIMPPDSSKPYFLVTYNGKAFDTQILKTRCLMNGMRLPEFFQIDLLHPARRLWKRLLPNCSQATIETHILELDRSGDIPGSMAPDIWFNFLRSGEQFSGAGKKSGGFSESSRALQQICDHNTKDIFGLATLFKAFIEIAASPNIAAAHFSCDEEALAINWKNDPLYDQLLEAAAKNYPRSCLRRSFNLFRNGNCEEARKELQRIVNKTDWKVPCTESLQAIALRSLAIDAQRRLGQADIALNYLEQAIGLREFLPDGLINDLEIRREKLLNISG